jgi:hypothetical protein
MQSIKLVTGKYNFFVVVAIFLFLMASVSLAQQATTPDANTGSASAAAQTTPLPAAAPKMQPGAVAPSQPPGIDPKTMMPLYETIQEDWSSLQIGASRLAPEPPLETPVDDQASFTRQLVQVKWRPGDPLDLWIILPKGVKKPPVALYLYDNGWDTDRFKDAGWDQRATTGGVAAVGFVAALSGHRFHDRPMSQSFVSELQESLGSTVHDIKFILDYLAQRGDVDMNRVGMFGAGSGGTIAILAAASDPRIKAVDVLDPWGDWADFVTKSSIILAQPDPEKYAKPEFLKKIAPLDPVKWLPQLSVPIRMQQVHQNAATPIECKESLKAAAPKQVEVVRFEAVSDLGKREGQGRLFDWIKERLQPPGKSGTALSTANGQTAPKTEGPLK